MTDIVVGILKEIAAIALAGNHDYAALGLTDIAEFNEDAQEAIIWTQKHLTQESRDYLRNFEILTTRDFFTLVHASPLEPLRWHYILTPQHAQIDFRYFHTQICLVGHSHSPMSFLMDPAGKIILSRESPIKLQEGYRYIINVGSVGQPRDGNPKACYAVYDEESRTIEIKRVSYNILKAQDKMFEAGIPDFLADRLMSGI